MSGNPHPAAPWLADRDAAEALAYEKQYVRQTVSNQQTVRDGDWTGQFGGLYVRTLAANFDLNTESTADDDDTNVLIDGAGNHFIKAVDSQNKSMLPHTTAGVDITIADDDANEIHKIVNTGSAAINVFLPDVTTRTRPIRIVDGGGNAQTYNITVKPKAGSSQTVMLGSQYVIDSNGASIGLDPDAAGGNWM